MIIQKNFLKILFKEAFKRPNPRTVLKRTTYSVLHIHPRYFAFTANPLSMFKFKAKN